MQNARAMQEAGKISAKVDFISRGKGQLHAQRDPRADSLIPQTRNARLFTAPRRVVTSGINVERK